VGAATSPPATIALSSFTPLAPRGATVIADNFHITPRRTGSDAAPAALATQRPAVVATYAGVSAATAVSFCGIATGPPARGAVVALHLGASTRTSLSALAFRHVLPLGFNNMTDKSQIVHGLSLANWEAMYRPGMAEFAASQFAYSSEVGLIRIAFGLLGPWASQETGRTTVYTHAVTMTPELAVALAHMLLKGVAQPVQEIDKPKSEG
jgi:hypothetical protein